MEGFIDIFVLKDKKLSSHTDHISRHVDSKKQKNYSYDQMSKMIVNLGSKKFDINDDSSHKITRLQKSLWRRGLENDKS